jgi:acetyl-CoA synthetase
VFPPPAARALGVGRWEIASLDEYRRLHEESMRDPGTFWGREAMRLSWMRPWSSVLEWEPPDAKWFIGGRINACYNCVDRQVDRGFGDEVAIVWEGEPMPGGRPEVRRLTYRDLQAETARFGAVLKSLGVKKGDVVTIYMPMIPELAVAVLACARIGAPHSVIFGGFAPQAIVERVTDAKSRVIITADGGYRRGEIVPLKKNVDEAVATLGAQGHRVEHIVTVKRTGHIHALGESGPGTHVHWYHELMKSGAQTTACEPMDSEDMLFLLYTSGSTGKPKGIVHTTGGYMVYTTMTARMVFNLGMEGTVGSRDYGIKGKAGLHDSSVPRSHDPTIPPAPSLFWCTADIGWVTGHSYVIYGILPNRVPAFMYEGAPNSPAPDRFWDMIERHRITHLYTAPTAIRAFMKWGDEHPGKHDMSSLKVLGTVGEPINPEAWMWYRDVIGGGRCPIVDTYWQTETGGHMITPLPGATPTKPGSCTLPMFGIDAAVVNEAGQELPRNSGGLLVIRKPWPGMLRGIFGDRERYINGYWSRIKEPGTGKPWYFSADGARRDQDGYFWIMGRVDDVINVAGHRLGTMEVESALVSHPAVAEAAVVGMPHEIKGTGICAFVTLKAAYTEKAKAAGATAAMDVLKKELMAHVGKEIGAIARPDVVRFTDALPKTRSGKIMRRLLRDVAAGVEKISQDTTTLEDFSVVARLRESEE